MSRFYYDCSRVATIHYYPDDPGYYTVIFGDEQYAFPVDVYPGSVFEALGLRLVPEKIELTEDGLMQGRLL